MTLTQEDIALAVLDNILRTRKPNEAVARYRLAWDEGTVPHLPGLTREMAPGTAWETIVNSMRTEEDYELDLLAV